MSQDETLDIPDVLPDDSSTKAPSGGTNPMYVLLSVCVVLAILLSVMSMFGMVSMRHSSMYGGGYGGYGGYGGGYGMW